MNSVVVKVVADARPVGNGNIFVENGTLNTAMPSDRAIVQNDRVFDGTLTPNDHVAT
jgi:hypothetical protein